ncbi:peptidoglycan DD-metalloendopeptidase family protein [Aquabacterium sp.]|uniref:M23 family metallopeptidase n=1 Tax=Aquabacterium sp. TaxID=1872578 RepID=UPI0035B4EDD3
MNQPLEFLLRLERLLKQHPRRVTAAVVALLAGTAVTAFGVAPLAADTAVPPQQVINETLQAPAALPGELEALEWQDLRLFRNDLTRATDTADTLLRRLGVDDAQAADFLRSDPVARKLLDGRAGKMVQVTTDNGKLTQLVARYAADVADMRDTHFNRISIERDSFGLKARIELAKLSAEVKMGSGTITSSLYAAADESHIPDGVTSQMAELFATDIDFRRELRKGDTFTVLYEALTADGEPVTWSQNSGRVLAARFVNEGKVHEAIWFQEAGTKGGYFDATGRSKARMFLASPLAFSRITSGFSMRFHPILQQWKAHLGVDYGAPIGTAVRSVGDGVVDFAGWQNGFGNVVYVKHGGDRMTVYGHLSRVNVHKGQRVSQGDNIALTGATGWATGPHLHFEFRVNGHQVDPLTIARASESTAISPLARARFNLISQEAHARLQTGTAVAGTNLRFE